MNNLFRFVKKILSVISWSAIRKRIVKKIENRLYLQNVIFNSNWLFLDKAIRLAIGFLLGVFITRYLGPERYGQLSYAMAYITLFGCIAGMGVDSIVIRELVSSAGEKSEILGSAFLLKLLGGIIALLLANTCIHLFTANSNTIIIFLVGILSITFIFQAFDVIDYFFQAKVQSKYAVLAKSSSFLVVSIFRVLLIIFNMSLIYFAVANAVEIILSGLLLVYIYRAYVKGKLSWNYSFVRMKSFLKESWPLVFGALTIIVYMKIDIIMITQLLDSTQAGLYAVAAQLSEVWFFIPVIIGSSIYPKMILLYNKSEELYTEKLQKILGLFFWISLPFSIIISLFSTQIIQLLYGSKYLYSAQILSVHVFCNIVICMSVIFSQRFILKKDQQISLYGTIFGAILNVILNFWLIPLYQGIGAALATVISYTSPLFVQAIFFDRKIAEIFYRAIIFSKPKLLSRR